MRLKNRKTITFLLLALIYQLQTQVFAQSDTTKKSMSFDFGFTRDKSINLWPVFKRTITNYEIDKQFLFPIYRNYQNLRLGEKSSHIIPLFWKDSSKYNENLRVISTYYPSLFHISKNKKETSKTFTVLEIAPHVNLLELKKSADGLIMQNNLLFFLWYQNNLVTKRSYFVVFPAYWQFKKPAKSTYTLLPIYSYGTYLNGKKHYRAITPLYWHFYSSNRSSNLLLPIWWNRTIITKKDTISSKLAIPLYYSYKDLSTKNKVIFPFIWNLKNSRYKSFTFAPLLSIGRNSDSTRNHLVISPLFWHIKNYENKSTTFFPIVWSNRWHSKYENYSSLIVFPIYWSFRDINNFRQIIPPLVWMRNTPTYNTFTLLPLLSIGSSPNKNEGHLIITPLFWYNKKIDSRSYTLLPIWKYKRINEGENDVVNNFVFPLYWGWKRPDNKGNILFPIMLNFKNTNYHCFTLLPITSVGRSADGKRSFAAITPLYWRFKTLEGNGQLLFPFWYQNSRTKDGELASTSRVAFLFWRYNDSERKHKGFFPLVWNLRNSNSHSFTFLPIYSFGNNKKMRNSYLAITPLFWHFRNPYRSFNTLFPLWWNKNEYSSKTSNRFNLIIPFYFSVSDSITIKRIVFPFAWRFKNYNYNSFTLVPLFSFGKSTYSNRKHLVVSPLFWHFKREDSNTTTLLPIFWHSNYGLNDSKHSNTVIFPIIWSSKGSEYENLILFPLIWSINNSSYKSLTFAPLFSFGSCNDNSSKHLVLTPLFYSFKNTQRKSIVLFPLLWSKRSVSSKITDKTTVLFPIIWSFKNQQRKVNIVFPISWQLSNSKSDSYTFFPFFSKGKNKKGNKYHTITPLYWQFDSKFSHRKIIFPIFTSYNDTTKRKQFDILFFLVRRNSTPNSSELSILWPIIKREKGFDYRYFRLAPIIWSKKSSDFSYFTIQPFFYHSISKEKEAFRVLWELFVHQHQFDVKRSNSILWKVATWDKYTNGDKEFRVLYLLFCNSHINGNTEKSLFPFYYLTKEKNGNRSLSVMLYFYNSLKRQIPNTKEYYQEERIFWLIRIRSNYQLLKQKGIELK